MRQADTAAGLIVAALGGATVYQASRLPYSAQYGPGAGFLPLWLGIALLLLSLALIRNGLRGANPEPPSIEHEAALAVDPPSPPDRHRWRTWLVFFGSTVGLALVFEPFGLWLSSAVFTLITVRWVAHRAWLPSILFAVLTPIVLYIGFVRLLQVPLPIGPFES